MGLGREMEGCGQCVKYLLFIANFLILLGGFTVLVVGVWTVVDKSEFEKLLGTDLYVSSAYILIATGVLVSLVAFLGCLGAVKEIRCMLLTYFIILLVLFVVLLVGGILGYVFNERVEDTITTTMMGELDSYSTRQSIKDAWDAAQLRMECCGVDRPSDWRGRVIPMPSSCCPPGTALPCTEEYAYRVGCKTRIKQFVKDHAVVLGGVGVGIACIMLLGMIFAISLFKMIE
ncbi:Tetraspanin-11 [Amphibalanus amphitrite]|uniref:Tetraspanin n=2 Tax=Amphibalanus amphitrite TaxID=1232801 RepID=A0A6A4XBJ2_AMPAM|nr:CD151 antigen-like [Amphibalanus amphitrite]XP_043238053.1 CD151 antigen-like [Amphibalanus amphitrite]XP_043244222.1 CD151 antigen-like isoform X2 [Amphibalanus amphitrite]KAF0311791.1 Tetraspanin-11 [Amphibalanus amphitrite]KAF0311792.1 Tetraspanin-11 [Amphibalanus amphitrite]